MEQNKNLTETNPDQLGSVLPSKIEQAGWEKNLYAHRYTEIPSNMGMRVLYDGNNRAEIVGYAPRGLLSGDDGWLLQKLAYNGSTTDVVSRTIGYGNFSNASIATYS